MSATTHLPPAASSGAPNVSDTPRATISPYKPVLFVALVLFAPALRETLEGNMPVQTALLRFIGSVAVSYVVIRLVLSVVESYAANRDAAANAAAAAAASSAAASSATASGSEAAESAGAAAIGDGMLASEAGQSASTPGGLGNTGP